MFRQTRGLLSFTANPTRRYFAAGHSYCLAVILDASPQDRSKDHLNVFEEGIVREMSFS